MEDFDTTHVQIHLKCNVFIQSSTQHKTDSLFPLIRRGNLQTVRLSAAQCLKNIYIFSPTCDPLTTLVRKSAFAGPRRFLLY